MRSERPGIAASIVASGSFAWRCTGSSPRSTVAKSEVSGTMDRIWLLTKPAARWRGSFIRAKKSLAPRR